MPDSANTQPGSGPASTKAGIFSRIVTFFKQVIFELKKVVTPTRDELWTYFAVVIVFVLILMVLIGLIDLGFGWLNRLVFT